MPGIVSGPLAQIGVAAVLAIILLTAVWIALGQMRRRARREAEMKAAIEGLDKSRRASEAARDEERKGAEAREDIRGDTPDSPHIRVRKSGENR